ncbi:DUF4190 domain-containing protein [Streptomyces sp. NPDC057638]|uniref:DUF4190 domain-containing protein n=1 Tax=Streptomyces sp. NPDC057638 TaxID=3346190 RepID=UPI0036C0B80B
MDPTPPGGPQPNAQPPGEGTPHPAYQPHPAYHPQQSFPGAVPGYPPPPPPPPSVNGLSIASLVTGIVCCLPPLGLVLGTVALRQITAKGQRGRGLAVAGVSLSAVSTLLALVLLFTGGFRSLWDGFQEGMEEGAGVRSTMDLRTGDCLNIPGDSPEESVSATVDVVDCDTRHEAEITGSFTLTGKTFPGATRIEEQADRHCTATNGEYALDPWAIHDGMEAYYYLPTEESWDQGDRTVTCGYAHSMGYRVTGSLRGDATTLKAPQLAYLRAESGVGRAAADEPVARGADALTPLRAWAGRMSDTLGTQGDALRSATWAPGVEEPIAERAQEFDQARAHYERAQRARSEEAFRGHVLAGQKSLRQPTELAVRKGLGLRTEPAADPERSS